ncbi:leucine-rich repeat-containing protein 71-like isoform X2 [Ostrinia furnacalis]|uniref:leucine-rich repeat-containing protein 71-like isoform X2 n=1 Tax=Ostrinia furnacalis TaxID=93504 RepID=UPI00103D91BB|nr:leucine-rich repeat-containing protein 71-like isoform X2 [Ostrinia furnacalis]
MLTNDDFYKQLKAPEESVKYKKITVTTPLPNSATFQGDFMRPDDRTTATSASEMSFDEDAIFITTYYDNVNNLTEIYLAKIRPVPRSLMQIIGYLAPSYEYLTKITLYACNIDSLVIHELSKILPKTAITDVCLDGSPVPEGNYFNLLDHNETRIKYLSLCRCKINDEVCKEIASRLHYLCPAERTLLLLNLSSNHITDEGAKCLGQALRTNRHLRYLNLADNHIGDDGADFIFDSLIEFRLTYDETMKKRKRRLEYLKAKRSFLMKFLAECDATKESDEYSQFSRKSGTKKKKTSVTSLKNKGFKKDISKKDKLISGEDGLLRAELFANELLGPFIDPFSPLNTVLRDGYSHCTGNMVLCYLNLSYNRLAYPSMKKLVALLQYQKLIKRPTQSGLVKVGIEGNCIPVSCVEYQKINDLTRLAKSAHNISGRMSITGLKSRSRQARISLVPQPSSGRN